MTNKGEEMEQLTVNDALYLIAQRAQWCRENGETDMRNIINLITAIESMIAEGKCRDEIVDYFLDDDDEAE